MDDVEAHVARPRDPADGVEVGAVVVEERARVVEDRGDLPDVLVEEAERRRVREHEAGRTLVHLRPQVVEIEVAAVVGLDFAELVAGHGDARGVRPVRRVGGDDHPSLLRLAAVGEVGAHEHQARQLALGAGRRLERDRVEPADLGEDLLQTPHELERPLRALLVLKRVQVAKARQAHDALVDPRVVLHGAGAERVEAGVDAERAVGERGEVAHELRLGDLGEARRRAPAQLLGDVDLRQVVARQRARAAAGPRTFEDELHAATSPRTAASRSTSAGVRFSVTATSTASSSPG